MNSKKYVGGIEFFQVDVDVNGNPRYVFHFTNLADNYGEARVLAKKLGAKPYRGKWYGGGFVMSSYDLERDVKYIRELATNKKFLKHVKSAEKVLDFNALFS